MAEGLDLGKKAGGVPIGLWVLGGSVLVGGIWFLMRRKSSSSSSATGSQTPTISVPATSGDFSSDQAQAIFSDIRNLQGQETTFSDTASQLNQGIAGVSNQVTGVSQQVSKIPAGPPGQPGPPGPAGVPGAAPPPIQVPSPPRPTQHEAVVHTDGKRSLQFYASEYGTSMAAILGATALAEPSDYNRASSALHQYIVRGKWSNEVPAGFTLYVPYVR